ncbi:MAG: hypothetical protein K2K57_06755 [Oscillospiraceae bacterium]|nr:hypothetical protein [Oscillospiraceae bacterium]
MKLFDTVKFTAIIAALSVLTACNIPAVEQTETTIPVTVTTIPETEAATTVTTTTPPVTITVATTTPVITTTVITTTELPFEDTTQNAYARLSALFLQEDGNEVAPEDYAGAYAYGGTLFVCTTSAVPGEYYTSVLGDYTCVEYKKMKHSLYELTEICERAKEILDPDFDVDEVYVDVPSNKAAVTIKKGDYVSARTFLINTPDLGFTLDMIEVSMAEPDEE